MTTKHLINYLSYTLSENTPLYGNGSGIVIQPENELINGDSCNTLRMKLPNHSGTHIDFPAHFSLSGKTLSDYSAAFWIFDRVQIVDISGGVSDTKIIDSSLFPELTDKNVELLLIKTGYGKYRGTDRYSLTPPGLSSELAPFLRMNLPDLRCIGMDLISISSFSNRVEGRKAHKAFLNPEIGEPILLIEDMKLDSGGPFRKVIVAPLSIENADGAPCTVFGYEAQ